MANSVRYSNGRLVYGGRLPRATFVEWTKGRTGRAVVDAAAREIRFALFGKTRAAGRRLWRQIAAAARDEDVADALNREIQGYLRRLGELAFADGLPRGGVGLRRLIVVPRVVVTGAAFLAIEDRLKTVPAFFALEGGNVVREFFIKTVVREADAAIVRARPSPSHPLDAGESWVSVGINLDFAWSLAPFDEPACDGHQYLAELTREPMTRAVRKAIAARIEKFEEALPSLCRAERNEVLRRALYAA
jgi:hypothetical protein